MPQYPSLAALRSGLTTDDADERGRAYSAVLTADVQPSAVLGSDPSEETVDELVGSDVIPKGSSADRQPAAEDRRRQLELLEEILSVLKGGS